MVAVIGLEKAYARKKVLKDVTFTLQKNAITALCGPNGAGKTTLLKIVAMIARPDAGSVHIEGYGHAEKAGFIGYVPQQNAFFHELTVADNLRYWQTGKDGAALEETVARLELSQALHQKASDISGGMQRRLNMAIGLVNAPRLLVMDEPLTGVDIATRYVALRWMRELKQKGITILYSTHHTDEIANTADCLILMRDGAVVYCGGVESAGDDLDAFVSGHIR